LLAKEVVDLVAQPLAVVSRVCAVFLAAMMVIPALAVTSMVAAQDEDDHEGVLRIGFLQSVDSLNPMLGLNDASYVFYGLVYDAFYCVDNDMNPVGNIATEIAPVPESDPEMAGRPYGSIWEYKITPNAFWHDGEPLTVQDVVYNVNLQAGEATYDIMWAFQPYSYYIEEAVAVDENTVRIYYFDRATKDPMAVAYGGVLWIPILPSHLLSTLTPSDIAFSWNGVFPGSSPPLVGSGPFMVTDRILDEWTAGSQITLVRNPDYHWGPDKDMYVQFDKIEMNFYDDATTMRIALTSGKLDIAQFPPETYRAIKSAVDAGDYPYLETHDSPKCTGYWNEIEVCMNEGGPNPSRLDPAIRHAMAMATNKTYIVQNFFRGLADEGTTLIPPIYEAWHYEPTESEKFPFDIEAASDLLEDSGYRYPSPGATVRVATADSLAVQNNWVPVNTPLTYEMLVRQEYPEEQAIARYLESVWEDIGIDLTITVLYESAMSTQVYSYNYDTCIWYWSMDIDPNYMLYCQSKLAWSGWSDNKYYNPAYEENYTKSVSAMNYSERKTYVDNCQRIHYLDAAFIIMAVPYQTYAWRTDTFSGWGNWSDDPGRSMDNFWSGNPLFFDLEYIGDGGGGFDIVAASIAAGVVVAIVVVVVVVWWMKKGGKKKKSPLGE
jgi:peptide/nickel transport system substrate-binding protein